MRKTMQIALAVLAMALASSFEAVASSGRPYGSDSPKITTLETSTGRRVVITTGQEGTIVTEERSGHEVWRSVSDRHEAKVKEYVRTGAKIVPPKK